MSIADPAAPSGAERRSAPIKRPDSPSTASSPDGARLAFDNWLVPLLLVAVDAIAIAAAFYVSWYLRYIAEIGPEIEEFNYLPFSVFFPLQLWLMGILLVAFQFSGLYRTRRGSEWFDDIPAIVRGTALGVMILFTGVALLRYPATSRLTFILAWSLSTAFVIAGRVLVQVLMSAVHRQGFGVERVLIVGGNNLGRMIMQSLAAKGHLGYRVVGFVDDDRADDFGRFRYLGGIDDVERIAGEERIDQVIVALPSASHAAIMRIVDHCQKGSVRFKIVPDLYEMSLSNVDVDTVSGIPLIGLKAVSIQGLNAVVKRVVDILIATMALLVCTPFMALIALLIRLESPGPVIYRHTRVGRDGVPFTTYKFRSMWADADRLRGQLVQDTDGDARLFKSRDDPRRTRIGALLRRWSLDELPQLWNVLLGDMSLVGPRPQIPEEVATYEEWHHKRLAASPGLTGLWQVSGRSELTFDEMVIYDIYYIENWSLGLDMRILLRTLPAVLRGRGAF